MEIQSYSKSDNININQTMLQNLSFYVRYKMNFLSRRNFIERRDNDELRSFK